MLKYFRRGGLLYGLVYTIWRSLGFFRFKITNSFYHAVFMNHDPGTIFMAGLYVSHPRNIHFGKSVHIRTNVRLISELESGRLLLGDGVQISDNVSLDYTGQIRIGRNTTISSSARLYTHDHGYLPHSTPTGGSLDIGENVWIGQAALILPAAKTIGDNAIVAAYAVVTKPVPAGAIVAGNPAKVIKYWQDTEHTLER